MAKRGRALRKEFETWMLEREHPVLGWIDRHWLERGDDPDNYADKYVQGAWVMFQALKPDPNDAPVFPCSRREQIAKLQPGQWTVIVGVPGAPLNPLQRDVAGNLARYEFDAPAVQYKQEGGYIRTSERPDLAIPVTIVRRQGLNSDIK